MKKWGFIVNENNKVLKSLEQIELHQRDIEQIRSSLDYDIDGIVYKINDLDLQKRLGIPQLT